MSFIYEDKKLVDLLMYHGLSKKAQQYVGVSSWDFAKLREIIANLEKQLASPTSAVISGSQIATESDQSVSLISSHMENLGTLIEFLARNKITVDGQRIAYTTEENPQNPAGLLELANRNETVQYGYYLNKDLLAKYLHSLQAELAKNPNPFMSAQINAVVRQANSQLDAGVDQNYQEVKTLAPNQLVDSLPKDIKSEDPMAEGPVVLTYGDIVADTSLNAWIQKNGVTLDGKDYRQFNRCGLLAILFKRATNDISIATSVQQKEIFQVYKDRVQKLAGEMQCDLHAATHPAATDQTTAPGSANKMVASLQNLIGILPLQLDQLDFGRIRRFVDAYRDIVGASNDPNRNQQAATAMNQLEQYMQAATKNTVGQSLTDFHMDGLTANDLVSWAVPPTAPGEQTRSKGSARALADYLEYVVRNVYTLVKDLYNSHYDVLAGNSNSRLRQAIEQQVGGTSIPYGSSIANSNIENIRAARVRLPQVGA